MSLLVKTVASITKVTIGSITTGATLGSVGALILLGVIGGAIECHRLYRSIDNIFSKLNEEIIKWFRCQ